MNIEDFYAGDSVINSPVAVAIKEAVRLIIEEAAYMEDTGEEFNDPEKYSSLIRILNAGEEYFRKGYHI